MKVTPENFLKVGLMAVAFIALARAASRKFDVPGLAQVVG